MLTTHRDSRGGSPSQATCRLSANPGHVTASLRALTGFTGTQDLLPSWQPAEVGERDLHKRGG